MNLRVCRLSAQARLPLPPRQGDAGYDLHAAHAATIPPGGRARVGTGISLALPEGHAGLVLPRSGLADRHGIALVNAPGLIDPAYRGELAVLLLNTDVHEAFVVRAGDRIAQLLLVPFSTPRIVEAEALEPSARGAGGFGSTGR